MSFDCLLEIKPICFVYNLERSTIGSSCYVFPTVIWAAVRNVYNTRSVLISLAACFVSFLFTNVSFTMPYLRPGDFRCEKEGRLAPDEWWPKQSRSS